MADGTLTARAGSLGGASMRYHELALQRWLNSIFYVREGFPVPVAYTNAMDAFSYFAQLWAEPRNPFLYLLDLKDETGKSLYEPHPSPIRYPIISVHRKSWKYRPQQNFSLHRWRHINWPTVSDDTPVVPGKVQVGTDLKKCALAEVTTGRRPMAWDYRFQVDHFCNRPDTQAFFIEQLMQTLWRTGSVPQTWIMVPYPGYGDMLVRLYLDGEIESRTEEEPQDGKNVEFRTTCNLVLEGYDVDIRFKIYPALWYLVFGTGSVDPATLQNAFEPSYTQDARVQNDNVTLDSRTNVPAAGTCSEDIFLPGRPGTLDLVLTSLTNTNTFGAFTLSLAPVINLDSYTNVNQFGTITVAQASYILADLSGTPDGLNGNFSLLVGSMDISPSIDSGGQSVSFSSGSYADVTVLGGTFSDAGSLVQTFGTGIYADVIVLEDLGTSIMTLFSAMDTGTYADVTVNAGSYFENGSNVVSFGSGVYTMFIIDSGTRSDAMNLTVGFSTGTYA